MTAMAHLRAVLGRGRATGLWPMAGRAWRRGASLREELRPKRYPGRWAHGDGLRLGSGGGRSVQLRPTARQRPLVQELHVHRVVLEERRARDHRHVVVPFGEDLRERVEPDEAPFDRRETELPRSVELDTREVEVDRSVGGPDELLDDRVELLRLLEARPLARRDVR